MLGDPWVPSIFFIDIFVLKCKKPAHLIVLTKVRLLQLNLSNLDRLIHFSNILKSMLAQVATILTRRCTKILCNMLMCWMGTSLCLMPLLQLIFFEPLCFLLVFKSLIVQHFKMKRNRPDLVDLYTVHFCIAE